MLTGFAMYSLQPAARALALLETQEIDFILSDIRMPDGDGESLLRGVRERNPNIPMIVLVSGFSELSKEEALALGAFDVLGKPFDFNVHGVTCIECSVKKLNSGRIDGVLYPKFLVEKLIKKNGLINLERIAFKQFEVKFVYSPQTNISKLDEIISKGIKKLRKENKLQIILNREVEVKSKQNFLY